MKELSDIEKSLANLARLLGYDSSQYGWKSQLAEWFGVDISVFSNWIRRGIPKKRVESVVKKGFQADTWIVKSPPTASKSPPGSTISPKSGAPIVPYEQEPERIGTGLERGRAAVEKEGLHARTQQIELGGQKLTVSLYSPGREWIHQAVDEIMASEDSATIAALESNVHVFVEKVRQEKKLEDRIASIESELMRQGRSNEKLKIDLAARHDELTALKFALSKAVPRPPDGVDERRASHIELTKILGSIPDILTHKPENGGNEDPR